MFYYVIYQQWHRIKDCSILHVQECRERQQAEQIINKLGDGTVYHVIKGNELPITQKHAEIQEIEIK